MRLRLRRADTIPGCHHHPMNAFYTFLSGVSFMCSSGCCCCFALQRTHICVFVCWRGHSPFGKGVGVSSLFVFLPNVLPVLSRLLPLYLGDILCRVSAHTQPGKELIVFLSYTRRLVVTASKQQQQHIYRYKLKCVLCPPARPPFVILLLLHTFSVFAIAARIQLWRMCIIFVRFQSTYKINK